MTPNKEGDWEKEFMDFYFEQGKYSGRKLGPEEYISFIKSILASHEAKVKEEWIKRLESLKLEYSDGVSGGDVLALKLKNHRELGYNQAIRDSINLLTQPSQEE